MRATQNGCWRMFLFGIALVLSTHELCATPLIIAQPRGKSAFVGDTSQTFEVLATGSPLNYQWQVSTDSGVTWASVSGALYSGGTGPTLTINNPDLTLDTYEYRCQVDDGGSPVNSAGVTLRVFPSPSFVPGVTVTAPSPLYANSTGNISIQVTGLTTGDSVRIQCVLSVDGDNSYDLGEPLIASFVVTDGQVTKFGGITDPNIPGDDDIGPANGQITTHISLPALPELGRTSGKMLIRVNSTNGTFRTITHPLTITQPTYGPTTGQSVSGQVQLAGSGTPIPNAIVLMLTNGPGNNQQYVASTVADASGNYSLNAPVGSYVLLGGKVGYTASFAGAPAFTLAAGQILVGQNPALTAATRTISGRIGEVNSTTGPFVQGMQFFVSSNNEATLTTSNTDGRYVVAAVPGVWTIETSEISMNLLGHLAPQNKATADVTLASVGGKFILSPAATAMVYGTLKDAGMNPLAGVGIFASDQNYSGSTTTDAAGSYYVGVVGNPPLGTNMWFVSVDDQSPALIGFLPPLGQNFTPMATPAPGSATQINFVAQAVTAHLQGTVTKSGSPLAGVTMLAVEQNTMNGITASAITDGAGNFDLGVVAGTWAVELNGDSAAMNNIIGPILLETVINGQTISGIAFPVISSGPDTISGTVTDGGGLPISNRFVSANATNGSLNYSAGAQTDGSGHYSFPVFAGIWTVNVSGPGFNQQIVTVPPSQVVNFVQSVITSQPQNQFVTMGQGTGFSIGTNTPSTPSLQWQRLPAGNSTWVNVIDDMTTYSGSTTNGLGVANTTLLMNGDQFRCVVSYGIGPTVVNSNPATLTVITPFQAWQVANFTPAQLSDPSISSAQATPAGDGVANLMKYALNLQPFTNCTTLVPRPARVGNTLTMTYQASRSDVTYLPQVSSNLSLPSWTNIGVTTTAPPTVTATFDTTGQPQTFMRLMVTMP